LNLGELTKPNQSGTLLLGPAGDLIVGAGAFLNPEDRVTNSPFHLYVTDLLALVDIPVAMRNRLPLVGRQVGKWYTSAMWPVELRNTAFDPVEAQLDLQARSQYANSTTRADAVAARFDVLLQQLKSVKSQVEPLRGMETYHLVEHLVSKLIGSQDSITVNPFIELDGIIETWWPSIQAEANLNTPRDRATWLVGRVATMKSAPKLLPADPSSSSGRQGGNSLLSKVQAESMVNIVKSQAFLELVADIAPKLATISAGQVGPTSHTVVHDVLRRCFKSDSVVTPITAIVQWLVSDTPALPYHSVFTQLVWVRENKAVYLGRGLATDDAWNPLPRCEGFLVLDSVIEKMDAGRYSEIHFFNDLYLALKSFMNSEPEVAVTQEVLWTNTDNMRKMLPACNKIFEMYGYGGANKPNSFASVITNAINFIDNAPTGLHDVHVSKVAKGIPLLLQAVGKTWKDTIGGMPTMPFMTSFVNPTLHAVHLQTFAVDQLAAQQVALLNKVYPGFLSHIASTATTQATVIPNTGLVTAVTPLGKRPATQRTAGGTPQASPSSSGSTSHAAAKATSQAVAQSPTKFPKKSDPDDYIGIAAHLVEENAATVTIKGARSTTEQKYVKKELAKLQGCKTDDKCWPVGVSIKLSPENQIFCNKKGQPGHTTNGKMHQFKAGFSAQVQKQPFRLP
jgi:hypothetical protein